MLNLLKGNWSTIVLFIAILGIGGYIYLQDQRIEGLKSDLGKANKQVGQLTTEVKVQEEAIKTIEDQYSQTIRGTEKLNSQVVKLREEQNEIQAKYNSYRERLENITAQRPETITRLTNRAFNNLLRDFERTTDRSDQTDQQSDSNSGETSENSGS